MPEDHSNATACNGVFKGGGAKGIAYVGALKGCEEAGIRFEAVAGSSAGAITAALVAAGFNSDELREHLPKGLQTLEHPAGAFWRFGRSALLSGQSLRVWLEDALASKVKRNSDDSQPCTFEELSAHSSIGLYVVAMDLASRQPVVFSHDLTPQMSVSDAVLASSAIPVAFPPVLVRTGGEVHRLVDGGAYANYPSFVFDDASFRAYHDLQGNPNTPTLGFILDEVEGPTTPLSGDVQHFSERRFDSDRGSAARELGPVGAVIASPLLRWSIVLLPFLFLAAVMLWLIAEAELGYPLFGSLPERWDPVEDIGMMVLLLAAGVIGIIGIITSIVLARLGRDMLDVGVMGASAAMGVGPNVPYWVGSAHGAPNHVAIRIRVPPSLGTLSFRASPKVVGEAIEAGLSSAKTRLAELSFSTGIHLDGLHSNNSNNANAAREISTVVDSPNQPDDASRHQLGRISGSPLPRGLAIGMAFYFGGALLFGLLSGTSLLWLLTGRLVSGAVLLGVSGAVALVAATALAVRKSRFAARPFPILGRLKSRTLILLAVVGMLLLFYLAQLGLSEGRASIPALAVSDPTEATVEHIDDTDDPALVWVTFGDGAPRESVAAINTDARGDAVTPCANPRRQPSASLQQRIQGVLEQRPDLAVSDRCVVFMANNDALENGEQVNVLVNSERGMAFLETELSVGGGFMTGPALYLTVGVMLIMMCYHSIRAVWWRQTRTGLAQNP